MDSVGNILNRFNHQFSFYFQPFYRLIFFLSFEIVLFFSFQPLKNLYENFTKDPKKSERISWWRDVLNRPKDSPSKSKL